MTTNSNLHQFPAKVGIVINLEHLRVLMQEYVATTGNDGTNDIQRLTLSCFLEWLRLRQRQSASTIYCWICRSEHEDDAAKCPAMADL